jgi:aspartyl-tRNA(Asn)/glutamyl-tRNA(Gln) amidotransferase subunit A
MAQGGLTQVIDDPAARSQAGAESMVESALARIARVEPQLNAFISVRAEEALAEAREIDARRGRGEAVGALAGLPVAVKDNIDVAGLPTTAGSAFLNHVAGTDAEVVRRLRAADAVVIGKTNLHEFAYGVTTNNPHHGPGRNAWDPSRIPGGSSGGSGAALGADACVLALGTDTGGSVRIPAALNGISGLRPTYGSVSTRGTVPVSASLDTVGPMARSIRDVAALHDVLRGYDRADPWAVDGPRAAPQPMLDEGAAGLRIGVAGGFFDEDVEPDVTRHVRAAAERFAELGADVDDLVIDGAAEAVATTNLLVRAEALSVHVDRLEREPERFGEDVRRRLESGRDVTGVDAVRAIAAMRRWRMRMLEHFDAVDVILLATTPGTAPPIAGSEMIATTARLTRFTYPWSLAGLPACSVPCGIDGQGLPVGLQLLGAPWHDDVVLRAAAAYQDATDWHRLRPEAAPPGVPAAR